MASSPVLLLLLAAVLQPAAAQEIQFDAIPCQSCQKITLQHYSARDCTAVFDDAVSECCPASFECLTEAERGIALDRCVYNNKTYAIGENIQVDDVCSVDCTCSKAFPEGAPAKVECAIVECPSLFNPPEPGCRGIHSIDKCCEIDTICTSITPEGARPDVTRETTKEEDPKCVADGKTYELGDNIYIDNEPCQQCVCTQNFTDAFGPGCRTIDCHIDYRGREELLKGCTPIYFDGRCCNIDWVCPDSSQVKPTEEQLQPKKASPASHCTLGKIMAARNESLATENCNLNCKCLTPPDFTCVQYSDCEAAKKGGESLIFR